MDELVNPRSLPDSLLEAVTQELWHYSVGFHFVRDSPTGAGAGLGGSGTLVSIGNTRAILTAHHVVERLPRTGRLGILLGKTSEPESVDTAGLNFLQIAQGPHDYSGPDLGAIILAPSIASAIGAKKSFYDIESRSASALSAPPAVSDGLWAIQGFVDERTTITFDADGRGRTTAFFNYCGFGQPEPVVQDGQYDYFDMLVSQQARAVAPRRWNGVSGGGLWQADLRRRGNGLEHERPILAGVAFYQLPTDETSCGVRCHGFRSVYQVALDAIRTGALTAHAPDGAAVSERRW